jgi:hypothetical protein
MLNPATPDDVEARWRLLSPEDVNRVQEWLDDAWARLQMLAPGLPARIASGVIPERVVVSVLAEAVIRKAQNPEGRRSGSVTIADGTKSWTVDANRATGEVGFTDAELALVSARRRGRIFSVMPS